MNTKSLLRIIAAIIGGEIALILLTTVAQEVLFDGISYTASNNFTLIVGGLATFIAAILAGGVARWIAKNPNLIVPILISTLVMIETIYLINAGITNDPVWFDILAGLALVIGIGLGLGFYFVEWWIKPKRLDPLNSA